MELLNTFLYYKRKLSNFVYAYLLNEWYSCDKESIYKILVHTQSSIIDKEKTS